MFLIFQTFLLSTIQWFYGLPALAGLFLIAPAIFLLIIQFKYYEKTYIPGVISLGLAFAAIHFYYDPQEVITSMQNILRDLRKPSGLKPIFHQIPVLSAVFEPIFSILVAPVKIRGVFQETLAVGFCTYLLFFLKASVDGYRKHGAVMFDVKQLVKPTFRRPIRSKTNELGSGDLANTDQIAKWTKPTGQNDTALLVQDLRGSDGISFKNAKLHWGRDDRNRHILMIAKTGGGKTSELIIPMLYHDCMDPDRSTIVLDSKPEMWRKLAAMTRKYSPHKEIFLFNPLDVARSLSWNILEKIEDPTDAKLIANTIIMATDQPNSKSDSPFFRNNALAILNAIMVGLLEDPNETISMPRIHEIVQSGMRSMCDWLEAHPGAIRTTRTFVDLARSQSQNADTIMSELSMRLAAWDLPAIRATTGLNELDLEMLVKKPTLFIIELRESELEMLRPLANVLLVEILRYLTKYAEKCPGVRLPRPVGFVIDEFASAIGRVPDIHVKLNTLRSRNVSIVAAIQSVAQVKAVYETHADSVLAGFSSKIFRPPLDHQDSEWASKETGQMTIRFETNSSGSNRKIIEFFASKNSNKQEQVQQRAVLTPDEIGRPVDDFTTFFLPNTPVFQGRMVRYYLQPEMYRRIQEFDKEELELKMRTEPIQFADDFKGTGPTASSSSGSQDPNALPAGISDTRGWSDDKVKTQLEEVRAKLDWENTTGSARKWWEAFESENKFRLALVLRLAEELLVRKATITEFFLAYVYSNTDNIQANLHYLDYTRLKKEEEKNKRDAASAAQGADSSKAA
jgi:type IV secretion system protein VirD4